MSAWAGIENRTAFICASQLHGRESDLIAATLLTRFAGDSFGLHLVSLDGLDYREFLS